MSLIQCKGITLKKEQCKKKMKNREYCVLHDKTVIVCDDRFKEDYCPVCYEDFEKSFKPLKPCGHYVHLDCVKKTKKLECPICRKEVKDTDDDMEDSILFMLMEDLLRLKELKLKYKKTYTGKRKELIKVEYNELRKKIREDLKKI